MTLCMSLQFMFISKQKYASEGLFLTVMVVLFVIDSMNLSRLTGHEYSEAMVFVRWRRAVALVILCYGHLD